MHIFLLFLMMYENPCKSAILYTKDYIRSDTMGTKKKKQTIGVIHQLDLIKQSPNKMNSSMDIVRQGVGVHRDKTKYNRKRMKEQQVYDGYHCVSNVAI